MRFIQGIFRLALFFLINVGVISLWENWRTGDWLPDWFNSKNKLENTQTVVLQEITSLGKLELVRYNFKDIVEQQITKLWLPDAKAVLIVQGEAVGCVDLTQMKIADIEAGKDTLVVHLPEPELCAVSYTHLDVYKRQELFISYHQIIIF